MYPKRVWHYSLQKWISCLQAHILFGIKMHTKKKNVPHSSSSDFKQENILMSIFASIIKLSSEIKT